MAYLILSGLSADDIGPRAAALKNKLATLRNQLALAQNQLATTLNMPATWTTRRGTTASKTYSELVRVRPHDAPFEAHRRAKKAIDAARSNVTELKKQIKNLEDRIIKVGKQEAQDRRPKPQIPELDVPDLQIPEPGSEQQVDERERSQSKQQVRAPSAPSAPPRAFQPPRQASRRAPPQIQAPQVQAPQVQAPQSAGPTKKPMSTGAKLAVGGGIAAAALAVIMS